DGTFAVSLIASQVADLAGNTNLSASGGSFTLSRPQTTGEIGGRVYADFNKDGLSDPGEPGMSNIEIRLVGDVSRTTTTARDGSYRFADLPAGTYSILETHPSAYEDGRENPQKASVSTVDNDAYRNLTLGAGEHLDAFDFGERGLRSDLFTLQFYFSSTPRNAVLVEHLDVARGVRWYAFEAAQDSQLTLSVDGESEAANLELYNDRFEPVAMHRGSQLDATLVAGGRYLVHVADGESTMAMVAVAPLTPDSSHDTVGNYSNLLNRLDVDNDGFVTPLDVLSVVDDLNRSGARLLRGVNTGKFLDVSRDLYASPIDALLVINHLNAMAASGAGGESETPDATRLSDDAVDFLFASDREATVGNDADLASSNSVEGSEDLKWDAAELSNPIAVVQAEVKRLDEVFEHFVDDSDASNDSDSLWPAAWVERHLGTRQ
ncbi:MAG TPA: SdrD B-like domain-containing protein, partial [Pirellulaceae bacterium]|nr:SdrD B-like domain-containing protein [Pirellulaceae bacterium]